MAQPRKNALFFESSLCAVDGLEDVNEAPTTIFIFRTSELRFCFTVSSETKLTLQDHRWLPMHKVDCGVSNCEQVLVEQPKTLPAADRTTPYRGSNRERKGEQHALST